MSDDERVTLRLPKRDLRDLDLLVETGLYGSRSEAIRQAIQELILRRSADAVQRVEARRKLAEALTDRSNLDAALETMRERETDLARKLERP